MSDLEKFRRETCAWLEANCPPEMRRPMTSDEDTFWGGRNTKFSSEPQSIWFERMRDKGWTVPHWPKGDGGDGGRPAAGFLRHLDAGTCAFEVRHRRTDERASAKNRRRADPLVPGL